MNRNHILIGMALAIVTPFVAYAVLLMLNDWIIEAKLDFGGNGPFMGFSRYRLLPLLGVCCNLIPFRYFNKRKLDRTMNGVVLVTLGFAAFWCYYYFQHFND